MEIKFYWKIFELQENEPNNTELAKILNSSDFNSNGLFGFMYIATDL